MNHQRQYDLLIAKAQARNGVIGYAERHHIVPRSLGGTNDNANLVELTAREHFIAHMLLARMHGGTQWYAVIVMKGNRLSYTNSKLYEIAKREHAIALKGKPLSFAHKEKLRGKTHTSETRAKMSAARLGNPGVPHTAEAREKIGAARRGKPIKPQSLEHRKKISFTQRCKALNRLIDSVFAVPA